MKRIHVVGNGPSWKDFSKISGDDEVIGCNLPPIRCDYTFISDYDFIAKLSYEMKVLKVCYLIPPVILLDRVKFSSDNITIHGKFTPPVGIHNASSGNYATLWAMENGYDEIHVWGIDSYFGTSNYTITSEIVKHTHQIKNNKWNHVWYQIKRMDTEKRVTLHEPITK